MKAFYCVGTHWDREWYEPFQEFRMWLVELVDELIELMEREPGYAHFHLDGQAIVIEDYLAIRPERRERLLNLVKEGRIAVGPWYVLPDEWLVSGESLIRNLMKGMTICRQLGVEPMQFAYTPDQFGHIAAIPMIMAGFHLECGIVWRGTQDETYPAHFVWVGPDGSRMATHKLLDNGAYGTFDVSVRGPIKRTGLTEENVQSLFKPYFETEAARTSVPLVLMLDALDHQIPDPQMPRLFEELARQRPDIEFVWGTLEQFGEALLAYRDELPERSGELREPRLDDFRGGQYLIAHTVSSRYPLKQRNDGCQVLLERWAEPYALFHAMSDGQPILRFLDLAWEYLLKNHPHDSICGCSIDQVHRDMVYRFDQTDQIADGVIRRAMACIGAASDRDSALSTTVVHNPLPWPRHGVIDVSVPFPKDWPTKYIDGLTSSEPLNKFTIRNEAGRELPFQLVSIDRDTDYKRLAHNGRKRHAKDDLYHLAIEMDLPPCGYSGFRVEPCDHAVRNFGSQRHQPLAASNGILSLSVNADGSVKLVCEADGLEFEGLFLYEDSGDAGDGWTRGPLVEDVVVTSYGTRVTTAVEQDGPLRTVMRIDRELEVPARVVRNLWRRSTDRVALRITDRLTLEKGLPAVRVHTTVENNACDHRLRVVFPTGVCGDHSFADTPFAIVRRPIAIPLEAARWHERLNPEKAFTSLCGIEGTHALDDACKQGFAVLAPLGLHEYEVTQTPEHSLVLTLFRATHKTVMTSGEPDGQLQGPLTFTYMLYPFAGDLDPAGALRLLAEAQAGVRAHGAETLPVPHSFLSVDSDACIVSAIKPALDGSDGIVRLWNTRGTRATARVNFNPRPTSAQLCDLGENSLEPVQIHEDGSIEVTVHAYGLASLRVSWQN